MLVKKGENVVAEFFYHAIHFLLALLSNDPFILTFSFSFPLWHPSVKKMFFRIRDRLFFSCVFSIFRSLDLTNLRTMQVPNEAAFSKFFEEKVSLSRDDIKENSKIINGFIEEILTAVRDVDAKFALKVLNTGNTDVIIKDLKIIADDEIVAFAGVPFLAQAIVANMLPHVSAYITLKIKTYLCFLSQVATTRD